MDQSAKLAVKQTNSDQMQGSGSRRTAKEMLLQRAEEFRREAFGLEALARALPANLGEEADLALWRLMVERR